MKKAFILFSSALLLFACAKVEETPVEVPVGKTYTIVADLDNPATRSLTAYDEATNKFKFSWTSTERINVVASGPTAMLPFDIVDPAAGTFSYSNPDDSNDYASFDMAVSPWNALYEVGNNGQYDIIFSGFYSQEQSNAIMVAGTPTADSDGNQHFKFKHVGALVKVSYDNVPAGTHAMVFSTPDHDITGTFTFSSATGVEAVAGNATTCTEAKVMFMIEPTEVLPSVDFYLPIPTGQYQTFNVKLVKLVDDEEVTISGSEQTFSTASPFDVERADVVRCPVVTVTPPPADQYYVKVTSNDDLTSGQYLIVYEEESLAFNGGLTTLDASSNGVDVSITSNGILSTTEIDAASFTITIGTSSSLIRSASGFYIGNNSNSNALSANKTTQFENTITVAQNADADIVSKGGAYLRYNPNSGQERFRYFKSSTYAQQKPIALYKLSSAAPVTEKELDSELYISGNIKKQFSVNEAFSFGDGIVKATYSNGESKTLTVNDVTVTGFNSSTPTETQQITLTYTDENGHSATGSYTVSIVGSIAGAKYKRVNTLTSGKKYLIAAGNGDGYIMPHPVSSAVQVGVSVTINNDEIASTESSDACAFTITKKQVNSQWYYVISYTDSGTTHYVAASSATNTKLTNTTTVPSNVNQNSLWNITTPSTSYGTFNIQDAGQTDRSILWRPLEGTTPFNKFGHYQGTGNSTYYNVELYEYTTATND